MESRREKIGNIYFALVFCKLFVSAEAYLKTRYENVFTAHIFLKAHFCYLVRIGN